MYPKLRIDALTDGIFAVAMTLLVLDVRLPDDLHPATASDLARAIVALVPRVIPYVVSFVVLGLRWLSNVESASHVELVDGQWARWWLLYLLLITCVPFSTLVVGRYPALAPGVWLYAVNTALIGLVGMRIAALTPAPTDHRAVVDHRLGLALLVLCSLLAVALSFFLAARALWVFALVPAAPMLGRVRRRGSERSAA